MLSRLSHTRLLRSAGLYTWALVGIPIVGNAWFLPPSSGVDDQGINVPMALLAYLVFGVSYWLATRSLASSRPASPAWDIPLLVLLTSAAVAVGLFTKTGLGALLMLIVAGVLPWLLSARVAVAWLVVAHVFLVPSFMALGIFNFWEAVFQASFYVGFAVFVLVTAYVARQQAAAREEQRRLNAELQLLMTMYGNDRVSWPRTQNWVMIRDFPLPAGWNFKTSDIVVILPDNYGFGEPLKHCFVDPALRFLHNGNWKKIDHYFDSERGYTPHPEFNAKGWRYLCLHMKTWTPDSWVQTYLDAITTFLSDPFAGWPTS